MTHLFLNITSIKHVFYPFFYFAPSNLYKDVVVGCDFLTDSICRSGILCWLLLVMLELLSFLYWLSLHLFSSFLFHYISFWLTNCNLIIFYFIMNYISRVININFIIIITCFILLKTSKFFPLTLLLCFLILSFFPFWLLTFFMIVWKILVILLKAHLDMV